MKAIQVKYLGATNTKGARLKVWTMDMKPKIVSRDYQLDVAEQASVVATAYALDMAWLNHNSLVQGPLPSGDYCFVLIGR